MCHASFERDGEMASIVPGLIMMTQSRGKWNLTYTGHTFHKGGPTY